MEFIVFPVKSEFISNHFNPDKKYSWIHRLETDWSDRTVESCNESLNAEITNEFCRFQLFENMLREPNADKIYDIFDLSGVIHQVEYSLNDKSRNEFNKKADTLRNLFKQDVRVLEAKNMNIYALVLIWGKQYCGHLYAYKHDRYLICLSVRTKIHFMFSNIGGFLPFYLEAARILAVEKECEVLVFSKLNTKLIELLSIYEFQKRLIPKSFFDGQVFTANHSLNSMVSYTGQIFAFIQVLILGS